jgi:hypothetical protein
MSEKSHQTTSPSSPKESNPINNNLIIPSLVKPPAQDTAGEDSYSISDIATTPRKSPKLTVSTDSRYDPIEPGSNPKRTTSSRAGRGSRASSPNHASQYQSFSSAIHATGSGINKDNTIRPLNVPLRGGEPTVRFQAMESTNPRTPATSPDKELSRNTPELDPNSRRAIFGDYSPTSSQKSAIRSSESVDSLVPSRSDSPEDWDNSKELRTAHPLVKRMEAHRYNLDMDFHRLRLSVRIESSDRCSHISFDSNEARSIRIHFIPANRSATTS